MVKMTGTQRVLCEAIIRKAMIASRTAAVGTPQVNVWKESGITPIQISMAVSLGKVFGLNLSPGQAEGNCMLALASIGIDRPDSGHEKGAAQKTECMGWKLAERFASDSQRVQKT